MKKLLISLLISFFSYQGIAQELDLFRTWYVHAVDYDTGWWDPISDINPPIVPYLTIEEDLSFNGEGACNTFTGQFKFPFPGDPYLETIEFIDTTDDCGYQSHNFFEDVYFGFLQGEFFYEITPDGGGLELVISVPIMYAIQFKDYPLSTPDFILSQIKVYPNPSSSRIFIEFQGDPVTKIELYSLLGQNIQTLNDNVESIDISGLVSGIYLLKISTEVGAVIKKIIKL